MKDTPTIFPGMSNEEKLARMLLASDTGHAMIRNLARRKALNALGYSERGRTCQLILSYEN